MRIDADYRFPVVAMAVALAVVYVVVIVELPTIITQSGSDSVHDSGILVVAEIFVENNAVIFHKVYERMLKSSCNSLCLVVIVVFIGVIAS